MPISRHTPVVARRLLARHPALYWLVVTALAAATGLTVASEMRSLRDQQRQWGTTREVLVTTQEHSAGDPLVAVRRHVPAGVVPDDAVSAAQPKAVLTQRVGEGEIVTSADVAGDDELALAPRGWLVAPVIESVPSGAEVGERVKVVSDGIVIAPEAVVVATSDEAILVAAPPSVAALLPVAVEAGSLTLLRAP